MGHLYQVIYVALSFCTLCFQNFLYTAIESSFFLNFIFYLNFYFLNYENMITHRRLGKYRKKLHIVPLHIAIIFLSR